MRVQTPSSTLMLWLRINLSFGSLFFACGKFGVNAPVAHLDRVTDFESVGSPFEPGRAQLVTFAYPFQVQKRGFLPPLPSTTAE